MTESPPVKLWHGERTTHRLREWRIRQGTCEWRLGTCFTHPAHRPSTIAQRRAAQHRLSAHALDARDRRERIILQSQRRSLTLTSCCPPYIKLLKTCVILHSLINSSSLNNSVEVVTIMMTMKRRVGLTPPKHSLHPRTVDVRPPLAPIVNAAPPPPPPPPAIASPTIPNVPVKRRRSPSLSPPPPLPHSPPSFDSPITHAARSPSRIAQRSPSPPPVPPSPPAAPSRPPVPVSDPAPPVAAAPIAPYPNARTWTLQEILERCTTWVEYKHYRPSGFSGLDESWEVLDAAIRKRRNKDPNGIEEAVFVRARENTRTRR